MLPPDNPPGTFIGRHGDRKELPMKHEVLCTVIAVALASCIPEWEPIVPLDGIRHSNDTLSLYLDARVTRSNQQFIDTLSVAGWTFDLYFSAYPNHGQGTLYVLDQRDSLLLKWSFIEADSRRQSFDRRPYRTVLSLKEYTGSVYLSVYGKKY